MPVLETPLIAATGKLASSDKSSSATSIGHTDAGDIPLFLLQHITLTEHPKVKSPMTMVKESFLA